MQYNAKDLDKIFFFWLLAKCQSFQHNTLKVINYKFKDTEAF